MQQERLPAHSDSQRRHLEQSLYFAYGSNLGLEQMAQRCPGSRFVGRARLRHYDFQINQRGFANVTRSREPKAFVEGLCYRLTRDDENKLDRSEGVPMAYQKKVLKVEFFAATPELIGRDVTDIISARELSGTYLSSEGADERVRINQSKSHFMERDLMAFSDTLAHLNAPMDERAIAHGENHSVSAMAMVYLSETHVKPGLPWDEYIRRMELGIRDALQLGVSLSYLLDSICPKLQQGRGSRTTQSKGVKTTARKVVRKPEGLVSSDYRSQRTTLPEEDIID